MSVLNYFNLFFLAFGIMVFVMTKLTLLSSNSTFTNNMCSAKCVYLLYNNKLLVMLLVLTMFNKHEH